MTASRSPRCALALAALLGAFVPPAIAQQSLGVIAAQCGVLDGDRELVIATGAPVPARAVLLASVAGSGELLTDVALRSVPSLEWTAIGARRTRAPEPLGTAELVAPVTTPLAAGTNLILRAVAARAGDSVCIVVHAFDDLASGPRALAARGAEGGTGTSATLVAAPGGDGSQVLRAASFALTADPGTFTPQTPGADATLVCAAGQPLCLGSVVARDSAQPLGPIAVAFDQSVTWSGVLAAVARDSMLGDGFE